MPEQSFKAFVLDQLSALPDVRARAMFGAHGLYQADQFFGILDEGRLFFKVSDASKTSYIKRGMGPFTYESKGRKLAMGYYEVPLEIVENSRDLADWAREAIQVATIAARKAAKKSKSPPAGKKSVVKRRQVRKPRVP